MKTLFFKAPWCTACHVLEPYVPEDIEHVDCDEDPETAIKYGVQSLPVFIAIDDEGKELARIKTQSIPTLNNWRAKLEEDSK